MTESIDAVPEADYVEQRTPAYTADEADSETLDAGSETPSLPADDSGWTASEGDLVEQAIPVPMDDDYEPDAGSEP
ncbi:hypothetical protein [Nocardia niigatensis]